MLYKLAAGITNCVGVFHKSDNVDPQGSKFSPSSPKFCNRCSSSYRETDRSMELQAAVGVT